MNTKTSAVRVTALALTAVLLAGCSAPSMVPSDRSGAAPAAAPAAPGGGAPEAGAGGVHDAAPTDTAGRQVARTASATIEVADLLTGADAARDLAESLGGWVTEEQVRLTDDNSPRSARITVSLPSNRLDEAIGKLADIGTVTSRTTTAEDVTDAVVDTDARIRNLEASIARVQALMERAGSVTEIAQVERELSQRQAELESLKARQQALRGQVERAPLTLTLTRPGGSTAENPFLKGLSNGWEAFLESIGLALTLVGALLPFALLAGLVIAPLVWWRRRRRAASAAATPAPAHHTPAEPVPAGHTQHSHTPATPAPASAPEASAPRAATPDASDTPSAGTGKDAPDDAS